MWIYIEYYLYNQYIFIIYSYIFKTGPYCVAQASLHYRARLGLAWPKTHFPHPYSAYYLF